MTIEEEGETIIMTAIVSRPADTCRVRAADATEVLPMRLRSTLNWKPTIGSESAKRRVPQRSGTTGRRVTTYELCHGYSVALFGTD